MKNKLLKQMKKEYLIIIATMVTAIFFNGISVRAEGAVSTEDSSEEYEQYPWSWTEYIEEPEFPNYNSDQIKKEGDYSYVETDEGVWICKYESKDGLIEEVVLNVPDTIGGKR